MLEKYYNKETYILILLTNFNSSLKDLPLGTKIIIFGENKDRYEYSKFNQKVNNIASSLTHGTIWIEF